MTGNAESIIKWLFAQDRNKTFDITEHRAKRSLNANAYCWALIGKMADALRIPKDEVYIRELKRYGQSEIVSVLSDIDVRGYFKYYEEIGKGHVSGKEFTHYKVFKGSSEYDSKEMAALIDGIIADAKELDIETLTENEIERMKAQWDKA